MKFITSTSDDGYAEREKENYNSKVAIATKSLMFIEKG